jgi:hypothetical protein
MTHLLATISSHGLGHLAQSAPVLNALRRRLPDLRLTVASQLPEKRLRTRIDGEFDIEPRALASRWKTPCASRTSPVRVRTANSMPTGTSAWPRPPPGWSGCGLTCCWPMSPTCPWPQRRGGVSPPTA